MSTVTPDEYRVRVYRTRRRRLFGRPVGREVWAVEVDYLGAWDTDGDQMICAQWIDADDIGCAVSLGLETARGIHEDGVAGIWPMVDPTDYPEVGPLVVHVGGRTVIDERVTA